MQPAKRSCAGTSWHSSKNCHHAWWASRRAPHRTIGPASCKGIRCLMPPAHVKPYVKRQKNDTADAEAILRSGHEAKHAVRADQNGRATELTDASSCAPSLDSPTDCGHQPDPH